MKKSLLILPIAICFAISSFAQDRYEFDFRHNDPNDVAKLLILAETGIDGALALGAIDLNLGLIVRYSLNDKIDLQAKIRKSYLNFEMDPAYRKNFEMEYVGTLFIRDNTKLKDERVVVSSSERGNTITTNFFHTNLPQRNAFGFNGGINFKTVGINPNNTDYNGPLKNVNFSTLSIIGGLQFKRINASVVQVKKPRVNRIFDNYTVMTIDGIFAPINTFRDAITGERVEKELKSDGLKNAFPLGGRVTYNVYGSIPSHKLAKSFRYTISSSIGYRPYLGFHFDFGIGFMILRNM